MRSLKSADQRKYKLTVNMKDVIRAIQDGASLHTKHNPWRAFLVKGADGITSVREKTFSALLDREIIQYHAGNDCYELTVIGKKITL